MLRRSASLLSFVATGAAQQKGPAAPKPQPSKQRRAGWRSSLQKFALLCAPGVSIAPCKSLLRKYIARAEQITKRQGDEKLIPPDRPILCAGVSCDASQKLHTTQLFGVKGVHTPFINILLKKYQLESLIVASDI